MKKHYNLSETEFELINMNLVSCLEEFDIFWTQYEELYVNELMVIEAQSRRFITEAIEIEKKLTEVEQQKRSKGEFANDLVLKEEIFQANQAFAKTIAKINSVANFEGHGRDDLTVDILQAANDILLKVTACESDNLRKLGKKIIDSCQQLRELLRKYNDNIEIVDPQLRNNPDLVEALLEYEKNWEKGKIYLLNPKRCNQLIFFTNVIEGLCEKYPSFKENLDCCDSEVFVQIPSIMLLKKIEKEDNDICEVFLPQVAESESACFQMFNQTKSELLGISDKFNLLRERNPNVRKTNTQRISRGFSNCEKGSLGYKTLLKSNKFAPESKNMVKKFSFDFYNFLEKRILMEIDDNHREISMLSKDDEEMIEKSVKILRHLSIEMQRFNPMEWNAFLDIAISR